MQLKEGISYKVNLKHLLICLFIELIIIVITSLILLKIDKSYENKIILFYLQGQLQIIENLIVADLTNIAAGKEVDDLLVIKNATKLENFQQDAGHSLIIKISRQDNTKVIADISNIIELIEAIAKDNFHYSITLNDQIICGTQLLVTPDITKNITINEQLKLSIKIINVTNSLLTLESESRINNKIKYRIINSFLFFILTTMLIFKCLSSIFKYQFLKKKLDNVIAFYKYEKTFITNCYEQSKKDEDFVSRLEEAGILADIELKEYLPIFLSPLLKPNQTHKVDITNFQIEQFVQGYNVLNNCNIELIIINNTIDNHIVSSVENEVLEQIIISIVRNFVQFRSSSSKKEIITLEFNKSNIKLFCTGIKLKKEHLIKWSKNIFLNTGNPYILNFFQIFKLLEISNSLVEIDYLDNQIQLDINLNLKIADNDNKGKIIKLCIGKTK